MKRLARLAIFVALAFVFFKLEIPYPVPNYEFLKLDLGEAFLLLGVWMFPLEDSLMALTVWAFLGYLTGANPIGMIFKIVSILVTLIPYHYMKNTKSKWIVVPAIRTTVMVAFNWLLAPVLWGLPANMVPAYVLIGVLPVNLMQAYLNLAVAETSAKYLRSYVKNVAS
ncbi:ECF transporter S component [Coprothermobacter platensis]|uniref:ECF transporter S component n=1 Tax=Coprothermobacter platensis TaxID=108819 RepID=UPI00037889EC|nr:ECF transporter S component [Coprothermobacter platensis]